MVGEKFYNNNEKSFTTLTSNLQTGQEPRLINSNLKGEQEQLKD
jgi:hypothetical protein